MPPNSNFRGLCQTNLVKNIFTLIDQNPLLSFKYILLWLIKFMHAFVKSQLLLECIALEMVLVALRWIESVVIYGY